MAVDEDGIVYDHEDDDDLHIVSTEYFGSNALHSRQSSTSSSRTMSYDESSSSSSELSYSKSEDAMSHDTLITSIPTVIPLQIPMLIHKIPSNHGSTAGTAPLRRCERMPSSPSTTTR